MPWFGIENTGNPSSVQNIHGARAKKAIQRAKEQIAAAIGAESTDEIIITSGATEANNLAFSILQHEAFKNAHVVTSATEHRAVLEPLHAQILKTSSSRENAAKRISFSPLLECGMADGKDVCASVQENTKLISIMAVNNETGVINPVNEIREGLEGDRQDIIIHCDAAQALGKIPLNVQEMGVDMMTLSGHKAYAPQGIGALYVRKNLQKFLCPILLGGGQQDGFRSGTIPVALTVAMGEACEIATTEVEEERARMEDYHEGFRAILDQHNISYHINGHDHGADSKTWRVPNIINIRFEGIEAEWLLEAIQNVSFSTGSACHSNKNVTHSHVLKAMGISDQECKESIRLSFGRFTTEEDIKRTAQAFIEALDLLEDMKNAA